MFIDRRKHLVPPSHLSALRSSESETEIETEREKEGKRQRSNQVKEGMKGTLRDKEGRKLFVSGDEKKIELDKAKKDEQMDIIAQKNIKG